MNRLFQEYKKCKVVLVDDLEELGIEVNTTIFDIPEEKQKYNRAKTKREFQRMIDEELDRQKRGETTMAKTKGQENLVSLADRTTEEQREIARKGGIASGKAKREKKMLKDLLEEALSKGTETNNEYVNITKALIKEANKGNVKAYEVIRDTLGQKPKEVIEVSKTTDETILEVEKYLNSKKEFDSK